MTKLSIIIPCYNEASTILAVVDRVHVATLSPGWEREIIVVDDGSTDGTRDILKNIDKQVTVVYNKTNKGKGGALKAGFKRATGDYILIQDADFEYFPEDYHLLLAPLVRGEGRIVFGSRNLESNNVPFTRVYFYGGLLLTKIFNVLFGTKITDMTTCYKVFPKEVVPQLLRQPSDGFVFDAVELTYTLMTYGGVVEVPIRYSARSKEEGKKLNWRHGVNVFFAMIKLRFNLDNLIMRLRFRAVSKFIKEGAIVADIGCGPHAHFLKYIQKKIKKGYGFDKKATPTLFENIVIAPIDLDNNIHLPLEDTVLNQVIMLAVIEHVYKPKPILNEIHRTLKKGGELLLTTPSTGAKPVLEFLAFTLGIIDANEIKDHKHYFTKQELVTLLQHVGFKNIKHTYFELGFNHRIVAQK